MNKLTERLLSEGYSKENYPKNEVYWDDREKEFYWIKHCACERTFQTPCGMLLKGSFANDGLSFMGYDFCYENDNPYIICPKGCTNCPHRTEPMKSEGNGVLKSFCIVTPTDRPYEYEGSCEAELKLYDERLRQEKMSFLLSKNGRVCEQHMHYEQEKGWVFHYDPMMNCANGFCNGKAFCPVLGRPLSKEKGNVYFDLVIEGRDYSKDGTIFEGERYKWIEKGIPLFEKPINLDIAKIIAKTCHDQIRWRVRWSRRVDSMMLFLAERGERDYSFDIQNVRAEKKVVRDFEQDLEDIQAGIQITHYFDEERKKKSAKSEEIKKRKEAKRKAIEKKILRVGLDALNYSEQRASEKLLTKEERERLDQEWERKQKEEVPTQMSIFDFMEVPENGIRTD